MDSILELLKSRTQELHQRLEQRLDLATRLASARDYAQVLAAFYGFYAPVEAELGKMAAWQPNSLDFEARRKTALIAADLACFQMQASELPQCEDLPVIDSPAAALGVMYVLEGATLGGQIIKRLLQEKLAITSANGGSFFTAYGDQVRQMWNEVREALSAYATDHPEEREAIVASASATFAKFDAWLSQRLT
jgi:heme oxygenase